MVTKKKKAQRLRDRNTRANKELKKQLAEQQEELEDVIEEDEDTTEDLVVVDEDTEEEEEDEQEKLKLHTIPQIILAAAGVLLEFLSPFITFVCGAVIVGLHSMDEKDYEGIPIPGWPKFMGICVMALAVLGWIGMLLPVMF